MRIIKSSEKEYICGRCKSVISIRPDELSTIGLPSLYDMDYEPDEVGRKYWHCPVCKCKNWLNKYWEE